MRRVGGWPPGWGGSRTPLVVAPLLLVGALRAPVTLAPSVCPAAATKTSGSPAGRLLPESSTARKRPLNYSPRVCSTQVAPAVFWDPDPSAGWRAVEPARWGCGRTVGASPDTGRPPRVPSAPRVPAAPRAPAAPASPLPTGHQPASPRLPAHPRRSLRPPASPLPRAPPPLRALKSASRARWASGGDRGQARTHSSCGAPRSPALVGFCCGAGRGPRQGSGGSLCESGGCRSSCGPRRGSLCAASQGAPVRLTAVVRMRRNGLGAAPHQAAALKQVVVSPSRCVCNFPAAFSSRGVF